jgi:hypothetical protein
MILRYIDIPLLLVVITCTGFVRRAEAQTITLPTSGVSHTLARDGNRTNTAINYADCVNEDAIKFSLTLANRGSYTLEVWAGASCDTQSNRTTTNSTACWKVYGASPNTNYPVVSVPVRSILYGRTLVSGSSTAAVDSSDGGTTTETSDPGVPDACNDKSGSTSAQTITLYFMLVDGGETAQGTITQWAATYKLVAPPPPDHVSAGIGENLLVVQFGYDDTSSDTSINGYQFFCDPPPGVAAADDAGVLPDASDATLPTCGASNNLVAGTRVDDSLQALRCGKASSTASQGNATGLVNGVAYNVAVAATDTYANTGKLSNTTCQVPQPVTGFFEAYRNAGGQGGGGFCSFCRKRDSSTLFAVLSLAAFLFLRRRAKAATVRGLSAIGRRAARGFIALESGAPWHWGWALAHRLGCKDCLILVQQSTESHTQFALRTERTYRGLASSRLVSVLGALHASTNQFVSARFSTPQALITHLERGGCTTLLPTTADKVLWTILWIAKSRPCARMQSADPVNDVEGLPVLYLSDEEPL